MSEHLCGSRVIHFIAREGSFFPCALEKGHDGGHRAAGNCFKHGSYLGDIGAVPNCPHWPKCAEPEIPKPVNVIVFLLEELLDLAETLLPTDKDRLAHIKQVLEAERSKG